ncbi:PilZ domain-containing protein [Azohydromonas lata]|uniref:PilZ domain-containing protein n=1 Tax=Azohydromonas lata TaxID=45677 RepID=A0ABU5IQ03_9BURK|nr:PilZ domain-containing protein [Azohydromonas lata]MDZ5460975.1 PilZ domain-containing protein [Azohydromonas lata]
MNTNTVWTALRRLWQPSSLAPAGIAVDDAHITGDTPIRRIFERLSRANTLMSLRSEDGDFDALAKLLSAGRTGLTLQLHAREGVPVDAIPPVLKATLCCDMGVLLFALSGARLDRHSGAVHVPYPRDIEQVQSRRHFRVTALNGSQYRAELLLPGLGRVPRVRNLSEEGVSFEANNAPALAQGTLFHNVILELDGEPLEVPVLQVVHCRDYGDYCTVGAHFEIVVADEARQLRRWIAAAQSGMLTKASEDDV